jgi:hypothetical protein
MNIKTRLAKLEASLPTIKENSFVFMTVAGNDNSEIIACKYKEEIMRGIDETFDDFQNRASIFFAENNPELTIFIIQCLYKIDDD